MATENVDMLLTNYKIIKDIDEKDETLRSLVECGHEKKQYYIYKRICELAVNSFVVTSEKWFNMEIDTEQNKKLLK